MNNIKKEAFFVNLKTENPSVKFLKREMNAVLYAISERFCILQEVFLPIEVTTGTLTDGIDLSKQVHVDDTEKKKDNKNRSENVFPLDEDKTLTQ